MSTSSLPNKTVYDSLLEQAIIFATLFRREALRAMDGSANQVQQASAQLRACLDRIDKLKEARHGG